MNRLLLSFRPDTVNPSAVSALLGALSPVVGYPHIALLISRASGKQSGGTEPADDDGQRSRQLAGE